MDKIYLVIIDLYQDEENSIVNICTSLNKAKELMQEYIDNGEDYGDSYSYHIDEVELDPSKDVLWDCYKNSIFNVEE